MSSAPAPPPPPPGPPVMASTSRQSAPSKKTAQDRSGLLSDIQKGTRLKSSKHLMNDRSGLTTGAANGRPSQNNGSAGGFNRCSQNNGSVGVNRGSSGRSSGGTAEALGCGKTNRGPPNLGDLFAGGIPRLRSSVSSSQLESSEAPNGPKRNSQIVRSVTQQEGSRMKSSESSLTNNNTSHVPNMSLRRTSTGTLNKPPVPGNKPSLLGPKPSLSISQRASISAFTDADKPISDSRPITAQPVKPLPAPPTKPLPAPPAKPLPAPPATPLHMQNHSRDSQTVGRNSRPVSCVPSFSPSPSFPSFLNMAESPLAFPVPRPCVADPVAESSKTAKRPVSTVFSAQTLNHAKSDHARVYPRPSALPPPLPKRETNGSSMSNSSEDATDYSSKAVSPSTSTVKERGESRSQGRKRQSRSSVAEEPSVSSSCQTSYDTDFEGQFRFHREKDFPPPDTFKDSSKSYPSKNPKNPANRGSFVIL